MVIEKDSTALSLRTATGAVSNANSTTNVLVASLTEGDIPVCLIKVLAGAGKGSRPTQFYGIKKLDSKFTAVNNSTETMKITKEGTFVKAGNTGTISLPSVGSTNSTLLSTNDKGISNGNILEANANVADNDFLRVDGTKIEGRTAAQVKTDLSLGSVDDTSDSGKPISTAAQTALDLKATINNPTFTGTIGVPNITNIETAIAANTSKITYPASDSDKVGHLTIGSAINLNDVKTKACLLYTSDAADE